MEDSVFKVVVTFERRDDGGIRAYCEDVPGLILSSNDIDGLISDVQKALSMCLSHTLNTHVTVGPLPGISEALRPRSTRSEITGAPGPKEFAVHLH